VHEKETAIRRGCNSMVLLLMLLMSACQTETTFEEHIQANGLAPG